jgi:RES domain-containing protein
MEHALHAGRVHRGECATRRFGTEWAKLARTPVLRIPGAVTRGEFNYLLNPRHAAFAQLKIGKPLPFSFDHRAL